VHEYRTTFDTPNWFSCKYDGGIGDETLPNFIKRKNSRKGEKKKQEGPNCIQTNSPKGIGGFVVTCWFHF
jgi:hypothetical protein